MPFGALVHGLGEGLSRGRLLGLSTIGVGRKIEEVATTVIALSPELGKGGDLDLLLADLVQELCPGFGRFHGFVIVQELVLLLDPHVDCLFPGARGRFDVVELLDHWVTFATQRVVALELLLLFHRSWVVAGRDGVDGAVVTH